MSRVLLLAALAFAPAAFACPGEAGATAATAEKGEHCNMPSAEAVAPLPADGTHSMLAVSGMHCGACADKVHTALMKVDGVKGARVDLAANKVEVAYDDKKTNLDKLVAAVATTGTFTATIATN